mgnify:CR=1 FL=1
MKRVLMHRGFSIIEAILVIAVVGIALTPFSILVVQLTARHAATLVQQTSVMLAEEELERVMQKPFLNITNESQVSFGGDFSAYRHEVAVDYVNATNTSALNVPVAGVTNYKRVNIRVLNTGLPEYGNVTITTLATRDW